MKRRIIKNTLTFVVLMLIATITFAAETITPGTKDAVKTATGNATTTVKRSKFAASEKGKKKSAKVKLVELNSATKSELKTVPAIDDASADKIIAGRPYLSKANLVTRKILPGEVYERIRKQIMVKPILPKKK